MYVEPNDTCVAQDRLVIVKGILATWSTWTSSPLASLYLWHNFSLNCKNSRYYLTVLAWHNNSLNYEQFAVHGIGVLLELTHIEGESYLKYIHVLR